jgi:DNA polymerase-3 subunit delta'
MPWNIVGHERAVLALQRALEAGSLAHAYLLVGPARIGKRTLALELAKALNCAATPAERPCGQCRACCAIESGQHPDVATISRGSPLVPGEPPEKELPRRYISIEQVRELQRTATLAPFAGRYRMYIIDGADEMNAESANCLLKILEEPPARVVLLLLCSNVIVVLPTVFSRCQRLDMGPLSAPIVAAAITKRWGATADLAGRLAQASEGRLGWAVEAVKNPSLLQERESLQTRLVEVLSSSCAQRLTYAGDLAALWSKDQAAADEVLAAWRRLFRSLLHAQAGAEPANLPFSLEQLQAVSIPVVTRALRSLARSVEQLRANANPRLVFDVLILRLPMLPSNAATAAQPEQV